MIKEIITKLEQMIKDECNIEARRYKGEFEEDADWNPEFPIALVQVTGSIPQVELINGVKAYNKLLVTIYAADKDIEDRICLDRVEAIQGMINEAGSIEVEDNTDYLYYPISELGFKLHGYFKGVEVNKIEAEIEI